MPTPLEVLHAPPLRIGLAIVCCFGKLLAVTLFFPFLAFQFFHVKVAYIHNYIPIPRLRELGLLPGFALKRTYKSNILVAFYNLELYIDRLCARRATFNDAIRATYSRKRFVAARGCFFILLDFSGSVPSKELLVN